MSRIEISITNLQDHVPCDRTRLRRAVRAALRGVSNRIVRIGVAIVDDATIHDLNRRHLDHDYPTDVLSYPLEASAAMLEGEIVVSAETAARSAPHYGWPPEDELCLYVVHGALHLAGFRDKARADRRIMREAEREVLDLLGIRVPKPREQVRIP
jgi:probable rRNA maturation factor